MALMVCKGSQLWTMAEILVWRFCAAEPVPSKLRSGQIGRTSDAASVNGALASQ